MSIKRFIGALIAVAQYLLRSTRPEQEKITTTEPHDTNTPPPAASPASPASLTILDGGEVALEVLQAMSYRKVLKTATIISFNMQDYDFWGHGNLSHLLLKQLSLGAAVRLMTTPPPGKPTGKQFKLKYKLLSELQKNGVEVFLNEKLHAKAYLFLGTDGASTAIIGSANLTGPGFGMHLASHDNLVEMAVICADPTVYTTANTFVDNKIVADRRTEDFSTWFSKNSVEIGKAGL
jgi:hypothetical protein